MVEAYTQLVRAYAFNLKPYVDKTVKTLCYGCEVDHPSQVQHNVCCMMEPEEQISYCLSFAVHLMEDTTIVESGWSKQLWDDPDFADHIVQEIARL